MSLTRLFSCCSSNVSNLENVVNISHVYLSIESLIIKCGLLQSLHIINTTGTLPAICSLEEKQDFIYDQGELGSCTANAFCAAFRIKAKYVNKYTDFIPSRLFFYYNERGVEHSVAYDVGGDVIDGIQYTIEHGICSETSWVYDISKFAVNPPPQCYTEANNYKISTYGSVAVDANVISNIKQLIVNNEPVLIAITIYDSFESSLVASDGIIPMPNTKKEKCLGGHEMCIIGYSDLINCFTVMNSWGSSWGANGKCYMPYTYITNNALCIGVSSFYL